jgi:hypothetical protein
MGSGELLELAGVGVNEGGGEMERERERGSSKVTNIKCTLVQALRLYTGRTTHRGSRGIALLYRH